MENPSTDSALALLVRVRSWGVDLTTDGSTITATPANVLSPTMKAAVIAAAPDLIALLQSSEVLA